MLKSLNKARKENEGKQLKSFEVMDNIYHKVRHRTNDGLAKIESLMKQHAHALYFDKKTELYTLMKEKKKLDDLNIERLLNKTSVPINFMKEQEDELKGLIRDFKIDMKNRKLPYREKIRQICNVSTAFYSYKKDQRQILDFSITKSPEYIKQKQENFENLKKLLRYQYLGEGKLSEQELKRLERLYKLQSKIAKMHSVGTNSTAQQQQQHHHNHSRGQLLQMQDS